ncbi:hypothetical protein [Pacificoceanicola onchidii]|uniref:hypothetical protein n=1 Tax=Pacificoceanicola onchidii TaxID=2562685 RepID=UPI0010A60992|nr:hypothetical protein [Pacificoceanicola onchidii]
MAVFGFVIGSCIGSIVGLIGWTAFDLSFLQAFSLYVASGAVLGLLMAIQGCLRTTLAAKIPASA